MVIPKHIHIPVTIIITEEVNNLEGVGEDTGGAMGEGDIEMWIYYHINNNSKFAFK